MKELQNEVEPALQPLIDKLMHQPNEEYFKPVQHHPFYNEICKAKIPIKKNNEPDLLMFKLPNPPPEFVESVEGDMEVDIEGDDETEEDDAFIDSLRHPAREVLRWGATTKIQRILQYISPIVLIHQAQL